MENLKILYIKAEMEKMENLKTFYIKAEETNVKLSILQQSKHRNNFHRHAPNLYSSKDDDKSLDNVKRLSSYFSNVEHFSSPALSKK